jgi:hypothetical protein
MHPSSLGVSVPQKKAGSDPGTEPAQVAGWAWAFLTASAMLIRPRLAWSRASSTLATPTLLIMSLTLAGVMSGGEGQHVLTLFIDPSA